MNNIDIKLTLNKDLKREFEVIVPNSEISKKINNKVSEVQKTYKSDGFRKGKVPLEVIKQKHSKGLLAEIAEKTVNTVTKKIIDDNKFRVATTPKVTILTLESNKDLKYKLEIELFPEIPEIKFSKINLEKNTIETAEKDIEESFQKVLNTRKKWKEQNKDYKAKKGDAVNIDFLGKLKGVPFEGGKGEKYQLELGSKSFIEGFEEKLIGVKAGDKPTVKVKFPKDYGKEDLAGQSVEFDIVVHSVLCSETPKVTKEFLQENFNAESVEDIKKAIKEQMESMYDTATQENLKEDLFEWLKKSIIFKTPESLIDEQFNKIWQDIEKDMATKSEKFKDDKEKKKKKEEHKKTAEEMVRIGLILSELGRKNDIKITEKEISIEIGKKARNFPGQEQMLFDYYQKNQDALNNLTGAILEEKVVQYIIEKSNIKTHKITVKDFQKKQEKRLKKRK